MGKMYPTDYRHWHESSEKYTGGDRLVSLLQAGWTIHLVECQEYPLTGGRIALIYLFNLKIETASIKMSVIANPFVDQLIAQWRAQPALAGTY